jgi:class 3 adenylate cyclase/CHASE2 domain-containing sensor protein
MAAKKTQRADPFELPLTSFRSRLFRNIGIGLAMGVLVAFLSEILLITDLELLIYDARLRDRYRHQQASGPITLVLIDEDSLKTTRLTESYSLGFLADLIDVLKQRQARVIGLDLVLSGYKPEDTDADRLKNSIRLAGNVILSGRALPDPALGLKNLHPPMFLVEAARASGLQHLNVGPYGRVRDGYIRLQLTGDQKANALGALLAQAYEGGELPKAFPSLHSGSWTTPFTFRDPGRPDASIPINYRGLRSEVGTLDGTFPCLRANLNTLRTIDDRFLKDKIVIVGSALAYEANRYLTPMGSAEMWTAEIIANMVETILDADFLRFPTTGGRILYLMFISLVAATFCTNRKLLPVMLLMLVYSLFLVFFLRNALYQQNVMLPYLPTLLAPWLTAFGSVGARVALDDREIRLLREVFGRSVSPAIAQELVAKIAYEREKRTPGGPAQLLSEESVCSILFLDVANFTPLSETFSPEKLFVFTNELLDRLADCVFESKGSLIRYTGDGLIALFGRPIVREDHAYLACEGALRMQEELNDLNAQRQRRGEPLVHIRIGINTGPMMVGLLGGHQRYDYSVLGNEVNIAARFERLNKDFGTMILVGEETVRELREEFICRPLGSITLKGKKQQVSVFELVCRTGEAIPDSLRNFLRYYEMGYLAIRSNRIDEAVSSFNQALSFKPDDLATQKLLARAEERTRTGTSLL